MQKEDLLESENSLSHQWYLCMGAKLRTTLLEWLSGKEVHYEDFDF